MKKERQRKGKKNTAQVFFASVPVAVTVIVFNISKSEVLKRFLSTVCSSICKTHLRFFKNIYFCSLKRIKNPPLVGFVSWLSGSRSIDFEGFGEFEEDLGGG